MAVVNEIYIGAERTVKDITILESAMNFVEVRALDRLRAIVIFESRKPGKTLVVSVNA